MKIKKNSRSIFLPILAFSLSLSCVGCQWAPKERGPDKLISINLTDPSGMNETISSRERLGRYEQVNFLAQQPYQKIVRVYGPDHRGVNRSVITLYHENGTPYRYVEIEGGRPFGTFREWYPNGKVRLQGCVNGGVGELDEVALATYQFHGMTEVWDEEGKLMAAIPYANGKLEGISTYYFPDGSIEETILYVEGMREGESELFYPSQNLREKAQHQNGLLHGETIGYWENGALATQEEYREGYLETGRYYSPLGENLSQVEQGQGIRIVFHRTGEEDHVEYQQGEPLGKVKEYSAQHHLEREYSVRQGEKHGEEIEYYPPPRFATDDRLIPKLLVTWYEGQVQGPVKTWYPHGQLESQREIHQGEKNGVITAWYEDGNCMLIEEYQDGLLVKGEYYTKGLKPVSRVQNGEGTVTLYDGDGTFVRRIEYAEGKPAD